MSRLNSFTHSTWKYFSNPGNLYLNCSYNTRITQKRVNLKSLIPVLDNNVWIHSRHVCKVCNALNLSSIWNHKRLLQGEAGTELQKKHRHTHKEFKVCEPVTTRSCQDSTATLTAHFHSSRPWKVSHLWLTGRTANVISVTTFIIDNKIIFRAKLDYH